MSAAGGASALLIDDVSLTFLSHPKAHVARRSAEMKWRNGITFAGIFEGELPSATIALPNGSSPFCGCGRAAKDGDLIACSGLSPGRKHGRV
jgi:hypothetical protein